MVLGVEANKTEYFHNKFFCNCRRRCGVLFRSLLYNIYPTSWECWQGELWVEIHCKTWPWLKRATMSKAIPHLGDNLHKRAVNAGSFTQIWEKSQGLSILIFSLGSFVASVSSALPFNFSFANPFPFLTSPYLSIFHLVGLSRIHLLHRNLCLRVCFPRTSNI